MPSSSPSSRRNASPSAPRSSISGAASRRELAPRGLHLGQSSSSNSSMTRGMHEKIIESKENSSQTIVTGRARVKAPNNVETPSKKPWSQHFAKPNTTLVHSPNTRVLGERNSSRSPVRSTSARGNLDSLCEKKQNVTSHIHTDVTSPAPKGVAELSKRIQQFLEDQESLIGVKPTTPRCNEDLTSTTQTDPLFSPPYDPYNSPFSERPKFLRLGTSTPITTDPFNFEVTEVPENTVNTTAQRDPTDCIPAENVEDEVEDGEIVEDIVMLDECNSFPDIKTKKSEDILHNEIPNTELILDDEMADEKVTTVTDLQKEETQANSQQHENRMYGISVEESNTLDVIKPTSDQFSRTVDDEFSVPSAIEPEVIQNISEINSLSEPVPEIKIPSVNGNDMDTHHYSCPEKPSLVRRFVGNAAFATFILAVISIVLLASGSPALLPANLSNNPVSCAFRESRYYDPSISFLKSFNALWSATDGIYTPPVNGNDILQSMQNLSASIKSSSQTYFHLAYNMLSETWSGVNTKIDTARQFEWIQNHHFPNNSEHEDTQSSTWDWDLLNEYDILSANHVITGSISEPVWNDFKKNMSRLSQSSNVQGVLEELMDVKGGNTFEDINEIIEHFEEYVRYTPSVIADLPNTIEGLSKVENTQPLIDVMQYNDQSFVELLGSVETSPIPILESHIHDEPENLHYSERSPSRLSLTQIPTEQKSSKDEKISMDIKTLEKSPMDATDINVLLSAQSEIVDDSVEQSLAKSDMEEENNTSESLANLNVQSGNADEYIEQTLSMAVKEEESVAVESMLSVENENADDLIEKTIADSVDVLTEEQLAAVTEILNVQSESPLKELATTSMSSGGQNTVLNVKTASAIGAIILSFASGLLVLSRLNKSKMKVTTPAGATNVKFLKKSELQQTDLPNMSNSSEFLRKTELRHTELPTETPSFHYLSRKEEVPRTNLTPESTNLNFLNKSEMSQTKSTSGSKYSMRVSQSYPEQMLSQNHTPNVFSEATRIEAPKVFSEVTRIDAPKVFSEVTMIEDLNDRLPSVLKTPESTAKLSSLSRQSSTRSQVFDDLTRSPVHVSSNTSSPYGSVTTYERVAKKERNNSEVKLTPVRRSSRLRNQAAMSPDPSSVKRVAISPP